MMSGKKMTKNRIATLRKLIEESRGRIMVSHPMFALLLMHLRFVADYDMKKMSTNGICVYFNPDFLQRLAPEELDILLCHQMLHIVMGHLYRPIEYAGDAYHYACDEEIKKYLSEFGWQYERYARLSKVFNYKTPGVPGPESIEEAYPLIDYWFNMLSPEQTSRYLGDSDKWWSCVDDVGDDCVLILDSDHFKARNSADSNAENGQKDETDGDTVGNGGCSENGDEAKRLREKWRRWIEAAMSNSQEDGTEGSGSGTPGYIRKIKESLKKRSELDWRQLLENFVQEQITDYSFSPPDRRFSDTEFMLPDFNSKEYIARDVLFMVDTSCSVEDEMLSAAYQEISAAIEQFNGGLKGQLGFFDWEVHSVSPFESITDLFNIKPVGGGGTSFEPIFTYIYEKMDAPPSCVVIITDGKGPYPDETEIGNIPVLWLINNEVVTPPFGKVVRIR